MGKFLTSVTKLFIIAGLLICSTVNLKADECSGAVDRFCKTFELMKKEVNRMNSFEDYESIDLDAVIEQAGLGDVWDTCLDYELTNRDRVRLKLAANGFVDAISNKMYSFFEGTVPMEAVKAEFRPMKELIEEIVDGSETLGDFVGYIAEAFYE